MACWTAIGWLYYTWQAVRAVRAEPRHDELGGIQVTQAIAEVKQAIMRGKA
ncbi:MULTISPECIES: hypothetical protein [unclassified Leifsonia]|uniref:hypothetical protein n=1 Tax=unclassified Leifsonia TaxID=2663824 RepID=UPI00087C8C0A|nr:MULTISPECIES: hypothetical protein [unclassified Leifsonia]SDH17502.1 hypothetical protein SAMN04515690_1093 [Leifsonia sp. 197AMF]SDJ20885.1 hypothetical protein SAMN04515684_2689 [Leifsonia sp. 466MF]SDJ44393.1 hypothetical protein SAMN04515683_0054 [Leifsonia sp. 157MF]SDN42475.1 hypothetical protein SAMN04515686_0873 [Leifsonia sp. 509MF]